MGNEVELRVRGGKMLRNDNGMMNDDSVSDKFFFFFKQKTAYEMCGRDWSSDVCSSDLNQQTKNSCDNFERNTSHTDRQWVN